MRISDRVLTDNVRRNLAMNTDRLMRVERELSSGRRLDTPSDDPAAVARALRLRTDAATNDSLTRTSGLSRTRLNAADGALDSLTQTMQRARELTVQASSGTLDSQQLGAIAAEMNQLLLQSVQVGNTSVAGQYVFAGTKTTTAPFSAAGNAPAAVTYDGNSNPIYQDVGGNARIQVDVPGDGPFLPAMNVLIQIRDALNSGNADSARATGLPALDSALDGVLQVRGTLGARINRLDALDARLGDEKVSIQTQQSDVEDIDLTDTIVRLNSARNVYDAALGAAAKAITPSLVDFLR